VTKFKRIALLVSAAGLALAMFSTSSSASTPKVDAHQYTVHCDTVVGTVGFAPPLSSTGAASPDLIKLKATLEGCTATPNNGGGAVEILSGGVTGKLTRTSQNCSGLLGASSVAGNITIIWKTTKTSPNGLLVNKTTVTPGTITGGLFTPGSPFTGSYGSFHIGGSGVSATGAFTGTDNGASSVTDATTGEDAGALLGMCGQPGGLKTIHLGIGDITLQ
jgi:hypothetical protein